MFSQEVGRKNQGIDKVSELRKYNEERARKGLKPSVPSWWGIHNKVDKKVKRVVRKLAKEILKSSKKK